MTHAILLAALAHCLAAEASARADVPPRRPNIVVILADDLGYGDVACYNPDRGKIATPHIDRLAATGMRFTDAHSSSAVCSPSRYALLTGRYHWRTRLQSGIVDVFGPPLIAPDRLTLAGLLKEQGYRTACIGKWHLGWDWPIPAGKEALFRAKPTAADAAARRRAAGGLARDVRAPDRRRTDHARVRRLLRHRRAELAAVLLHRERSHGRHPLGVPRPEAHREQPGEPAGARPAGLDAGADPARRSPAGACDFIERAAKEPAPFFLYLPLTAPHTPIAVNEPWKGKSGLNAYADFVMETDAVVGGVLDALERSGAAGDTLVVFTSDNGCSTQADIAELKRKGHFPSGPLRGYKADVWEGGHRVPFLVRWPGVVKAGTRCDQLVQQADLMATFAEVLGTTLPDDAGEDSVSLLPLLRGGDRPVRESRREPVGARAARHPEGAVEADLRPRRRQEGPRPTAGAALQPGRRPRRVRGTSTPPGRRSSPSSPRSWKRPSTGAAARRAPLGGMTCP